MKDEDAVARRAADLYGSGLAKRNEARAMVRLDPVDDGDAFASGPAPTRPPASGENGDGDGGGEGDEGTPAARWGWSEAYSYE